MIAVVKEKFRGVKTLMPEQTPNRMPKRVDERISDLDRQLMGHVLTDPIQYVDNPLFHDRKFVEDIEADLGRGLEEIPEAQAKLIPIELFEESDKAVTSFKSLTQEQEMRMFLRLNYCRFKVLHILRRNGHRPLTLTMAREILKWKDLELRLRSQLTQANIPLVLAMAKRMRPTGVDFSELISEGNMALLRSIDKFDCSRGFKFSTYACRAILKSFSRAALKMTRYRGRFPVEFDPDLERGDLIESRREDRETHCVDRIRDVLADDSEALNDIERRVLRARFGIREDMDEAQEPAVGRIGATPMTLEQVGKIIGVTKERVRQIQNKALAKLREELEETVLSG